MHQSANNKNSVYNIGVTEVFSQRIPRHSVNSHFLNKALGILSIGVGLIFFSGLVAFITNQFDIKIAQRRKRYSQYMADLQAAVLK